MAITWTTDIHNVNIASKRADVTFMRTDDATGRTWSKSYTQVILETTPQRLALLDQVWSAWLEQASEDSDIETFLGTLEQTANSNLAAREA